MDRDTQIGGEADRFPLTRRSVIEAVRGDDPSNRHTAVETLIAAYWKPIYKHIRLKWRASNEEAKDLTQGFFASVMERSLVDRYVAQRASFRTFLRMCADGFVSNERKAAGRMKRGGDHQFLSLDFDGAERELDTAAPAENEEARFDHECVRSLLERAMERLEAECAREGKSDHWHLFQRYDLHHGSVTPRPTYDELAAELGVPTTQVTNHLAWARRAFRRHSMEVLRELCGSDEEYRDEARRLLGVDS